MRIAVIDDERPARGELICQIAEILPKARIKEADSGAGGLELLSNETFDILFIDINLNDMEGTSLAAAAKKMMPDAQIIFATAYSQYAVKAFELGVNNYILKPFVPDRIRRVLDKCADDLKPKKPAAAPSDRLAVNTNRKIIFIDIKHIVYIETYGRSCIIHTLQGDHKENQLLGDYEKRLSPHKFFRIHKSYLIHLDYITELFPWSNNGLALKMQGYEQNILPVGREKAKPLRQLLGI